MKGLQMSRCDKQLAEAHYKDLKGKPFFSKLVQYICSGPVVGMVSCIPNFSPSSWILITNPHTFASLLLQIWEGTDVVKASRKIIGATNPTEAEPGTIRGDLAIEVGRNIVHGSDSVESAEREISKFWRESSPLKCWR